MCYYAHENCALVYEHLLPLSTVVSAICFPTHSENRQLFPIYRGLWWVGVGMVGTKTRQSTSGLLKFHVPCMPVSI